MMDGRAALRGLVRGGIAGAVATAPMTLVMEAGHRMLPRGEQYPLPPREITEQVARGTRLGMPAAEERRVWLTLVAHFGYGAAAGAVYGAVAANTSKQGPADGARRGIAYGIAVWTVSYLGILPALGLLSPATAASAAAERTDGRRARRLGRGDGDTHRSATAARGCRERNVGEATSLASNPRSVRFSAASRGAPRRRGRR